MGSTGPIGAVEPARHSPASTLPQRHGVNCNVAAHCDEKMSFRVRRQTCVSLTGAAEPSAVLQAAGAVPAVSSHRPPDCATSRQPLSVMQLLHFTIGSSPGLSRDLRHSIVLTSQGFVVLPSPPASAPVSEGGASDVVPSGPVSTGLESGEVPSPS